LQVRSQREKVNNETPYLMGSSGLTLATGKNGGCRSGFVLIADVPGSWGTCKFCAGVLVDVQEIIDLTLLSSHLNTDMSTTGCFEYGDHHQYKGDAQLVWSPCSLRSGNILRIASSSARPRKRLRCITSQAHKYVERGRLQQLSTTPIQLQATHTLHPNTMSVKDPITGGSGIGFDFSNHARNQHLGARMGGLPKGMSTILHPFDLSSAASSELINFGIVSGYPSYLDGNDHCGSQVWRRRFGGRRGRLSRCRHSSDGWTHRGR
jgi:hypothetical protein